MNVQAPLHGIVTQFPLAVKMAGSGVWKAERLMGIVL